MSTQLFSLNQEERIEAQQAAERAVVALAGEKPIRERFKNTGYSELGSGTTLLFTGLALLIAVAAFIPSAMRLYEIGFTTFGHAIANHNSQVAAGISSIMLAESGVLAFSLFNATLHDKTAKRVVIFFIGLFSVYALVGNIQLAMPNHWGNPFAWLESVVPPVAVLGAGFMLENQLLVYLKQRQQDNLAYDESLSEWKIATANPRSHGRYRRLYANSLRDAFKAKNGKGRGKNERLEYMAQLQAEDWVEVVLTEMAADEWFVEPVSVAEPQVVAIGENDGRAPAAIFAELPLPEEELVPVPKVSSNGNGHY